MSSPWFLHGPAYSVISSIISGSGSQKKSPGSSSAHASLEMLTVRFSPHVPARTLWPSASRVSTRSCDHRHTALSVPP